MPHPLKKALCAENAKEKKKNNFGTKIFFMFSIRNTYRPFSVYKTSRFANFSLIAGGKSDFLSPMTFSN